MIIPEISPRAWVRIHTGLAVFWALLTIPAVTLWRESVPFLVSISMAALVLSSIAAVQAARADKNSPTTDDIKRVERKVDLLLVRQASTPRIGRGRPLPEE